MRRSLVPIALFALTVTATNAWPQQYHVRTYTETDGLPSSTVFGMTQTADGRMWFATRSGIAAYDGVSWDTYDMQDGLPAMDQRFVGVDSAGRLWAVGSGGAESATYRDGERWRPIPPPAEGPGSAAAFAVSTEGVPGWLAVAHGNGPVLVTDGSSWRKVGAEGQGCYALAGWEGRLYLGTRRGVWVVDPHADGAPTFVEASGTDSVLGLAADPVRGGIWVIRGHELGFLRDGSWESTPWGPYTRELQLRSVADGRGGVLFGGDYVVYAYHPARGLEPLDHRNGLVSDGMGGAVIDREGCPWISCGRGVSRIVDRAFASYGREHGLPEDEVTAIRRLSDGTFVLGHPGALTFFVDPLEIVRLDRPTYRVLDIVEDDGGDLWIIFGSPEVARVDRSRGVTWYGPEDGLPPEVSAIHRLEDGTILVVGREYIGRWTGERFESIAHPPGLLSQYPRRILVASNDDLYVATSGGLVRRRGASDWVALHRDGAGSSVYALQERAGGEIWMGAARGLFRLDGDVVSRVTEPAIERPIYFLVDDANGSTWIGTDNGVFVWDGSGLRHHSIRTGLVGRETNRSACVLDASGRMWVGTDGGLSVYRPALEKQSAVPPVITLLPPESDGETLDRAISGRFVTAEGDVQFPFRAVLFAEGGDLRVRSRLLGLEDSWSAPRSVRVGPVRHPRLPPGAYRLQLQAMSAAGWTEPVTGEWIQVRGPIWRRPWFRALAVIVVVLAAVGVVAAALQGRYARRLRRDVQVRTEELAAQKERLAVTLGGIADGVIATDLGGRVTLMNRAAEKITSWPRTEALGRAVSDVLDLDGHVNLDTDAGTANAMVVKQRDGTRRSVEVSLAAVREGGRRLGSVFVFRDVTQRLRAEEELIRSQKLEAVGILAGGIAHDFNNLLMVILGQLSLLDADGPADAGEGERLSEVKTAALRARSLTRQLLTFAKGGDPVRTPQSIGPVLRESASFALLGSGTDCRFDLPDDLWPVEIDADQMGQVIGNLVINARQAMPAGGTIYIRARNLEPAPRPLAGARAVRVEVEDEGPGVAPEAIDRVFEPYFSTKSDGSGLGLATSHSIVRKHEGRLSVESPPGKGAIFRIDLPAAERPVAPAAEERPPAVQGRGRVLVMDDDEPVRQAIEGMLRRLGYEVRSAAEGRGAIEEYRAAQGFGRPFDAVLMDLTVVGGLGGRETAEAIRRIDPEARIIVSSGYSADPALADPASFGFQAAIEKPFLVEDLARVLRGLIPGDDED